MFEAIFVVGALVGALSLAFAILAFLADYILPSLEGDRPQATRRRK